MSHINQSGVVNGINFDAHYHVKGWPQIAFVLLGWEAVCEPILCYVKDDDGNEIEVESGEFDQCPDYQTVIAVMVGDDRKHRVDIGDLELIPEDGFCRECGQIGCTHNVYT